MPYWAPAFVTVVGMVMHRAKLRGYGPMLWAFLFGAFYVISQISGWV